MSRNGPSGASPGDVPGAASALALPPPDERTRALHATVRAAPSSAWRLEPEERKRRYLDTRGEGVPPGASAEEVDVALERAVGAPDFLPGTWLAQGARRTEAVGMVRLPNATATGFLVSPWLLLTNAHVLPHAEDARGQDVLFRYVAVESDRDVPRLPVPLDPDSCFVAGSAADDGVDFALVALAPLPEGRPPGAALGYLPLRGATGKVVLGDHVNILQHAGYSAPLQVAVRSNLLVEIDDERHLTYETDTESGSSGSPVLSDRWDLVAVHSRAVSARDEHGRDIDRDGRLVTADTPASRRVWVANRGERVSAVVTELRRHLGDAPGDRAADLITEALELGGNS